MEFKLPDFFNKKKKKTKDEIILDLEVRLRRLEDEYKVIIVREIRAVRYARQNGRDNTKAVLKVKNAYYGLGIVKQARENLRDVRTTHDLCKTMNDMGAALKVLNRLSNSHTHIKAWTINHQINKMDKNAGKRDGNLENAFQPSIDALVSDDIVERLLNGEDVNKCLEASDGFMDGMGISQDMLSEIEALSVENTTLEGELNSAMEYVRALENEL